MKLDSCPMCAGKKVLIRGHNPSHDKRIVCPTCMADRLRMIEEISNPDYGKSSSGSITKGVVG